MKKLSVIFALLLVASLVVACSGGGAEDATSSVSSEGQDAYKKSCIGCHGGNMEGVGSMPALKGIKDKMTKEEIVEILKSGTPNGMPGGLVPGKEDAVAEYLMNN